MKKGRDQMNPQANSCWPAAVLRLNEIPKDGMFSTNILERIHDYKTTLHEKSQLTITFIMSAYYDL